MSMSTGEEIILNLEINGRQRGPLHVRRDTMLIDVLHEHLGLTGTRFGCGVGECRVCTVIVDELHGSHEMPSCISPAHVFEGKAIRTIEGHARYDAEGRLSALSPAQQAFVDHFSFQCGYCTPGFVNAATVLLEKLAREPVAENRVDTVVLESLDSHLCRCTGYVRYCEAIKALILETPGLTKQGP